MKWLKDCLFLNFILFLSTYAADIDRKDEIQSLSDELAIMKSVHLTDIIHLKREIEELKEKSLAQSSTTQEQNEKATLRWAQASMDELRQEMRELSENVNNSVLLLQLHIIRNELKQALVETSDLAQLARTQEARLDKLDNDLERMRSEEQEFRSIVTELRSHILKLSKEFKTKQIEEMDQSNYNDVLQHEQEKDKEIKPDHSHRLRHNKMIHAQISRLAKTQDQIDAYQQNLQMQLLDIQRRLDRFEEPNWNLLSAKVEFLEMQNKIWRKDLENVTLKISDFDRVHASMLELREDVENIENKADKTVPEFRKEISKLDVCVAKLNADSSYLKEDQENLRQSVKAIAVSVSNAIDRAEMDRLMMNKINGSVFELMTRSKQHFYQLNDHILKTETYNDDSNISSTITLPELIGEVKELQPVQREYEDLVNQLPKDCSNISGLSGNYLIHPGSSPIQAWCFNGSTVLQRRYNGTVEFNRKFSEYVQGFGDPNGEHWIGLESMHQLTADNCSSMRIDMTDIYGDIWYAEYEQFSVGNGDSGYLLNLSGFKGNASDAFEYQNHMEFSAIDRDRDVSNTHCAANYEGGWWFSHCQHVNINGKYTLGLTWFDSARNEWIAVAEVEMRIFRRNGCF